MDESKMGNSRRRPIAAAPVLESLEGRRLLAARALTPTAREVTANGVTELLINGTNRADVMTINDSGADAVGNVTVTFGNGSTYTSTHVIAAVVVQGRGGNDQVTYNLNGALTASRTLSVDLGAGNDQFTANVNGAVDNDAGLAIQAFGDAGNDGLTVNQSGATRQGTFIPYLDGGSGSDTLTYNGTGAVAASATLLPALIGGSGNDRITSNYSGQLDGSYIYNLSIDGGAGNDTIAAVIDLASGSTGAVGTSSGTPAVVKGGTGNDTVQFAIRAEAGASATINAVAVGERGKDSISRTSNVLGDSSNETDSVIS